MQVYCNLQAAPWLSPSAPRHQPLDLLGLVTFRWKLILLPCVVWVFLIHSPLLLVFSFLATTCNFSCFVTWMQNAACVCVCASGTHDVLIRSVVRRPVFGARCWLTGTAQCPSATSFCNSSLSRSPLPSLSYSKSFMPDTCQHTYILIYMYFICSLHFVWGLLKFLPW